MNKSTFNYSRFSTEEIQEISRSLNKLLADVFALYIKTKNFHWHIGGSHFRDNHLMLDEQATELFTMTDEIAERVRKIGGNTLHSIGEINQLTTIADNNKENIDASTMLQELCTDNRSLAESIRATHVICDKHEDISSSALLDNYLDQTEKRAWFLYEASQK